MNLSDNLKKIRKENNLSQEDLAEKLNVSRQSVSKWEQGIAYPEMDKVLQICKMFNLSIDELLNQNISEVEKSKTAKNNINKYLDDFLAYVSKTVSLISSMRFKDILKLFIKLCLFVLAFYILSSIFGSLLSRIFGGVFSFLPIKAYNVLHGIFSGLFILVMSAACIILLVHIFKTRYLDYYEIAEKEIEKEEKEESKEEVEESEPKDKKEKKVINEKREKIIIRDEKHSEYRFINVLVKIIVFGIKLFVAFIGIGFCASFVALVVCLVSTFLISKSGLLFVGAFIGVLSGIVMNFIFLYLIYNFIVSRKVNVLFVFATFIISLLFCGVGIGLAVNSVKSFKVIDTFDEKYMSMKTVEYNMNKGLSLNLYTENVEYIEENRKNIKIEYEYSNYNDVVFVNEDNHIYYYFDSVGDNNVVEYVLNNLNEKVFVNPEYINIRVYASKDTINQLKENTKKAMINETIAEKNRRINELEEEINRLEDRLESRLDELDNEFE